MTAGLPVSRLINVDVILSPVAASFLSFDTLLIIGDTDVIDTSERLRSYGSLAAVAADFGTSVPEYLAAALFFGQSPQPRQCYIGRWAQTGTKGRLYGGTATTTLATWTAITTGAFKIAIDGASAATVSGLNFSSATNMNGVAAVINAGLTGATCTWDGTRFVFKSDSTGASSSLSYLTAPGSGTDIKALIGGLAANGATLVNGIAAETAVACAAIMDGLRTATYGVMFASTNIVDADHLAVAAYIEGSGNAHVYGVTTQAAGTIDSTSTTDLAYQLSALGYNRTVTQYSSSNPYAVASLLGRAFTVDFNQNNSTITLMYKQEPGIVAESLTSAQTDALEAKNCNVFVAYNNDTAIIEKGVMASGFYFDEIQGTDWLRNRVQTDVFNLLYTSPTKIPQTDDGNHLIANTIESGCAAAVNNGLLAPGVWNSTGFGQIKQGDFLTKGYYIYAPPISSQAQADREARKSVSFQVAAKLAGAVHSVDVAINVNR